MTPGTHLRSGQQPDSRSRSAADDLSRTVSSGTPGGGSSAHTATVLTRGCRQQLDSARVGSRKPEAASADTAMRPDWPVGQCHGQGWDGAGLAEQAFQASQLRLRRTA